MSKQSIAKAFYDITKQKATKQMFLGTMQQAHSLLEAGYEEQDIISAIQYCYEHPPRNGFQSLGWLQYDINNIIAKLKAIDLKEKYKGITSVGAIYQLENRKLHSKQSEQERAGEEFNFDIFGGQDNGREKS